MKELLHERLREWVEESRIYKQSPMSEVYIETNRDWSGISDEEIERFIFNHFADEIERYYIPRPRFENGEVLKDGGEIEYYGRAETVVSYLVSSDVPVPYATLHLKCGESHNVPLNKLLKRPQPKVLDADGVEIDVGDTVWDEKGNQLEVKDIDSSDDQEFQEHLVWCGEYKCGIKLRRIASDLTHKEPDSLTKLLADMRDDNRVRGMSYIDRLTAIIEREA